MSNFNLKEDWKYIAWKGTLLLNLYRSIAAGFVWMIIMLIVRDPSMKISTVLSMPVVVPIAYYCVFLPLGLITSSLSRMGIPYIGLLGLVSSIFIVPGDPALWIFDKITGEKYLPVKEFGFVNFEIIIFAIDEDRKALAQAQA